MNIDFYAYFISSFILIVILTWVVILKRYYFIDKVSRMGKNIFITVVILLFLLQLKNSIIFLNGMKDRGVKTADNCENKEKEADVGLFRRKIYKGINILFSEKNAPAFTLVKLYLDDVEKDCVNIFEEAELIPLNIYLEDEEEAFKSSNQDIVDLRGIFIINKSTGENTIRILVKDVLLDVLAVKSGRSDFKNTLRHEYCHYYLNRLKLTYNLQEGDIPLWFEEGMAEYIASCSTSFKGKMPEGVIPLKKLIIPELWQDYIEGGKDPYSESYYAVYNLIKLKGLKVIKNILAGTASEGFEASFERYTEMNICDYEALLEKCCLYQRDDHEIQNTDKLEEDMILKAKIKGMKEYLEYNPYCYEAYTALAAMYVKSQEYDMAVQCCEEVVKINPKDFSAWNALGLSLLLNKDYHKCTEVFDYLLRISPGDISIYKRLAEVMLLEDWEKPIILLNKALDIDNSEAIRKVLESYEKYRNETLYGDPMKGCFDLISGEGVLLRQIKLDLIDKTLEKYPNCKSKYKEELLKLREQMET
ncbi:tetratricopeptide repeat protein [Clostridium polynesiense]|uniref:tetratricopeptide repeat protein n=1 Tax=Clostridium polynesiense TaxID=1325933 RepID=UPI00058BB68E|nr:collagenase [Clostridium polynesiense]